MKKWLNLLNTALYTATGCLWIANGLEDQSAFEIILGLIWLAGAVIWVARFVQERKESKKEK